MNLGGTVDDNLCSQTTEFFEKNKFVVIRNFIDKNLAALLYQYCITKSQRANFMYQHARQDYRPDWDGQFGDNLTDFSYNSYGDPMMDTLLPASTGMIEKYTGLNLIPNYTYWRFYQRGEILPKHIDRPSCEISTTLCVGYDNSNLDDKEYNWPIWLETIDNPGGEPIYTNPGDMIIYRGCDIKHWREKFQGVNHAQVFLHYNDKNGPYQIKYDGRPILGIPRKFSIRSN